MYTEGLISQAYVYPHKQSLLSQTIFLLFLHKTGPSQHSLPSYFGPLTDSIEDAELWLARAPYLQQWALHHNIPIHTYHMEGASDISPPKK